MSPLLRILRQYMKPYLWLVLLGLMMVILPVAMELLVPRLFQYVVDKGIKSNDLSVIIQGALFMVGAAVVGAIAIVGQGYCRANLSHGIAFDIRNDLFTKIQAFSFANVDQIQTGSLMTRLSTDVDILRQFTSGSLAQMVRTLLMIVGSLIMMFNTDWFLSLIVLGVIAVAGFLLRYAMVQARTLFSLAQQKLSLMNAALQKNLTGMQIVKAFVRQDYEIEQFDHRNMDYMTANLNASRLIMIVLPILMFLTNLGLVIIVWAGGFNVIDGRLSLGELIAFTNYLLTGFSPLLQLSNVLTMISRTDASSARLVELLDMTPEIQLSPSPHRADTLAGQVRFEQVSFSYLTDANSADGSNEKVLENISFTAEPGQTIAIIGATGAGKTTLVNLIPRFYEPTGGHIFVDGIDVRDWDINNLRDHIGVVLQQTMLFKGTVRENIAYGKPEASLEEVITAAKAADIHDFILSLPQAYESMIETRGGNLSGGQQQRLAIARALLISPSILIMDDSTSAVDVETEGKIQDAIADLMANRTTFIIAQRISSVLDADQILILHESKIVAQGTHEDLMKTSEIYQDIYQSQLGD